MRDIKTFTLPDANGVEHAYTVQQHGGIAATKLWFALLKIVGVPLGQLWDSIDKFSAAPPDDAASPALERGEYFAPEAPVYESTLDHELDDDGATDDAAIGPEVDAEDMLLDDGAAASSPATKRATFIKGQLAGRALQTIVANIMSAGGPKLFLEIFRHTQRDGVHLVNPTTMRGTGFDQAYGGNLSEMIEALYEVLKANFGSFVSRPPFVGRSEEIVSFMGSLRPPTKENPT